MISMLRNGSSIGTRVIRRDPRHASTAPLKRGDAPANRSAIARGGRLRNYASALDHREHDGTAVEPSADDADHLSYQSAQATLACDPSHPESRLPTPADDELVAKAITIIWNDVQGSPLNVNEVARQLPVTRRTLDRRFAASLGRSVLEEINLCRISRAKRLLAETDMLVKTVSFVAGFPSRERMRLLFLKEEGLSPTEYREHTRAEGESGRGSCATAEQKGGRPAMLRVS